MKKTLEIFATVILVLILAVTILTMPWPVSVVMGALILISSAVIFVYELRKKRAKEEEQAEGIEEKSKRVSSV